MLNRDFNQEFDEIITSLGELAEEMDEVPYADAISRQIRRIKERLELLWIKL